jgi:hypothetical protein
MCEIRTPSLPGSVQILALLVGINVAAGRLKVKIRKEK